MRALRTGKCRPFRNRHPFRTVGFHSGFPAVSELAEGTVLELHHRFQLLDGTVITDWQTDGPLAFEPGSTDLPSGFHELIGDAHIGDSLQALLPPVRAWGMSRRKTFRKRSSPVSLRVGLYQRPG